MFRGDIYCGTIEETERFNTLLIGNEIQSNVFHARLPPGQSKLAFRLWKANHIQVLCATIALGMGIDKANTRFVINTVIQLINMIFEILMKTKNILPNIVTTFRIMKQTRTPICLGLFLSHLSKRERIFKNGRWPLRFLFTVKLKNSFSFHSRLNSSKKRKRFKDHVPTNKFELLETEDDDTEYEESRLKEKKGPPIVINDPSMQPADRLQIYNSIKKAPRT